MFSIFEYVILVFVEHNNFRVFSSNSRRNHANRQIKNIQRFVKN